MCQNGERIADVLVRHDLGESLQPANECRSATDSPPGTGNKWQPDSKQQDCVRVAMIQFAVSNRHGETTVSQDATEQQGSHRSCQVESTGCTQALTRCRHETKASVRTHCQSDDDTYRPAIVKRVANIPADSIPFRLRDAGAIQILGVSPMATNARQGDKKRTRRRNQSDSRRQQPERQPLLICLTGVHQRVRR